MSTPITSTIYPQVKITTFVANPKDGDIDLVISDFVSLDGEHVEGWRVLPHVRKNDQWVWDGAALFYTSLDQIVTHLKAGKFSK